MSLCREHNWWDPINDSPCPRCTPNEITPASSLRPKTHAVAIIDIAVERERQKSVEGWSLRHDDDHDDGELAMAAACYVLQSRKLLTNTTEHSPPTMWPWEAHWWKPKGARRDLIRAGALIVAEIERLDRAELRESPASHRSDEANAAAPQPVPPLREIIQKLRDELHSQRRTESDMANAERCAFIKENCLVTLNGAPVGFAEIDEAIDASLQAPKDEHG